MSSTASTLTDLASTQFGSFGVRNHTDRIQRAADAIDANPTAENIEAVVRRETRDLYVTVPQSFIDTVVHAVSSPEAEAADTEAMAFLTDEQVTALVEVATQAGYPGNEDDLRAAFVTVGLLPEPVVEVEPEVEEDAPTGLLARLVEFAKAHGFKG